MNIHTQISRHDAIEFTSLPRQQAEAVKDLWQQFNALHHIRSVHFKEHFSAFTFAGRMEALQKKERVNIFCAVTKGRIIGYCLSSLEEGSGERDSFEKQPSRRT